MNKETMIESLHKGVCKVTFEKVDGTTRVMNCTLNNNYLPELLSESDGTKMPNHNNIPVWDTDNGAWRSFRIDSVQHFETSSLLTEG